MKHRTSSFVVLGVRMLALSLSLLVSVCFSVPALATSPGTNGKIVFVQDRSIFTVNPDGTGLTMVAAPPANLSYQDPAWSPDGNRIAFISSNLTGALTSTLNVMNADGTALTGLTSSNGSFSHPTWSPDGLQIAFATTSSVTVINSDGSNSHNLLPGASQPAWSPDGKKIAVVAADTGTHIALANADGTGAPTPLTNGTSDTSPTWSPDGTQIAFVSSSLGNQIYRIKVDGTGGPTKLSNGADSDTLPSWSPDGTRIAFKTSLSGNDIWTMSAVDGSGRVQLTNCDCANSPDWQPIPAGSLPLLSINDVRVLDGNFATTNATFTVSLSTASNQSVTVNFATADGTAISGTDYQANSGTLAFAPGETSKQITVLIFGNTVPEPDKTFFVNLSNPSNAIFGRGQGTGTILNANTTLSINDVTVTRGESGTTTALFTVSLSPPASFPVTVAFATADGTAASPLDYVAQSGSLTFSPQDTSKQISIAVNGRIVNQPPQTFFVNLSNPTNAILAKAAGVGTIINPGFPPVTPGPQVEVARFAPGDQFQVPLETQTMGMNAAGDFVIAWVQPGTPQPKINESVTSIYAQRFNSQGVAQGTAFRVDDPNFPLFNLGSNWQPAVAMDAGGNFVVVWTGGKGDTANLGGSVVGKIHGQLYDAFGKPVGPNFIVNTSDDGFQEFQPSVAMYASGDFVVAWSATIPGCAQCVLAQRFDAGGARHGDKVLVSSLANGGFEPAVAVSPAEPAGSFVSVWNGRSSAGPFEIFGRLFDGATGAPQGSEFRVNTFDNTIPENPVVGMDANGNFTAAWEGDDGAAGHGIGAQRFSSTGLASGGQFEVNATTSDVHRPAIGVGASGDFVVAWDGVDGSTGPTNVFARAYHGDGTPQGGEFRVNEATLPDAFSPAARMDCAGNFVVSWQSDLGANLVGILFRRFAAPPPAHPCLIIGNALVAKPASGTADAVFTVRLSSASTQTITVDFSTADGTAAAGTDYTVASGTLTFAPGETSKQIVVQIYSGPPNSSDKTFFVNVSKPTGAGVFLGLPQGKGTILAPHTIDYTISATPASLGLVPSSSKTSAITLHSQNGVSERVQLSADWVGPRPTGVRFAFSPAEVSVPSSGDSPPATLTVTTQSPSSIGTFTLRITGTSTTSGVVRFIDLTIVIADYTISATPASLALLPSESKTSAITLHSQNGFSETVALTADWVGTPPAGATITLSSTPVSVPSSGDSAPTDLTITTQSSTPVGSSTVRISGTSATGVAKSVDLTVVIEANHSGSACGCTKAGPFVDPRVKALVQPDPQTGEGPNGLATVSGSGFITVIRNSDGSIVVPATSDVSAFGFSPNGKFFVLITKQDSLTGPTFAATLYSVEKAAVVGASSPLVTNVLSWGFSPDSDNQFFLVTSSDNLTTHVDVAIYDTGSGTRVMFQSVIPNPSLDPTPPPPPAWEEETDVEDNDTDDDSKNEDKNIGGWGFSPDGKTFLLSYKTGQNQFFLGLWSLTHPTAPNFQVFTRDHAQDVAGFWQFSPCGDLLMWVHQAGANPATSDPVEFWFTSNERLFAHANLDLSGIPSATLTIKPDGTKHIVLTGMASPTIVNPDCTILSQAHSPVDILLTDGQGRSTGFDPVTGGVLNQIPGGSYTGVGTEPETVSVPYAAGPYLLGAFGLTSLTSPQPYHLSITITDGSGDVISQRDLSATATRGSQDRYGFTVERDAASGVNRILVPPLIEPVVSGTLGNNDWYVSDVVVSWNLTPLSEITATSGCQPFTVTSDTPGATFTCTATSADGTTSQSVTIKRNATPPAIAVLRTPPPNANGWNNTDVTVSFTASALSGIASISGPVTLTLEGANQVVTGTATSVAGVSASMSVTVNIDKTPPEAFIQFDPTQQDLQVFGRDALSGISADPFSPISVVRVSGDQHDGEHHEDSDDVDDHRNDGNADEDEGAELRTYRLEDLAGNTLLLVELVKKEDHEIKARVVTTQYNDGPVLAAPRNTMNLQWSLSGNGKLEELEQRLAVRAGATRQDIEAKFEDEKNQTTIEQEEPKPEEKFAKPGVVLLRMATDKANLVVQF